MPKRKKTSFKKTFSETFPKWFLFSIAILILFVLLFHYKTGRNQNSLSLIESDFQKIKASENADVSWEDNLSVRWIAADGLNIINEGSSGIVLEVYGCESEFDTKTKFKKITQSLSLKVNQFFQKKGFAYNDGNSSKSIQDDFFYDYIQAFQKGDLRCTFIADSDCSSLTEGGKVHYTFSLACTDKFDQNYQNQAPYLKDLGIKDAAVRVRKADGNFILLDVFYRRSGHYIIAKLVDGHWQELFSGQDIPPCQVVEQNQVPKSLAPECY